MLKALSPIFSRDRGTSKSPFVADQRAQREGMSETGVKVFHINKMLKQYFKRDGSDAHGTVSSCDRYC